MSSILPAVAWLCRRVQSALSAESLTLVAVTVRLYPTAGAVPVSKHIRKAFRFVLRVVSFLISTKTSVLRKRNIDEKAPSWVNPKPSRDVAPGPSLKKIFLYALRSCGTFILCGSFRKPALVIDRLVPGPGFTT